MVNFVNGQILSANDLTSAFAQFLPIGGVSNFSQTLLALIDQPHWLAGLGVPNITTLGQPNGIATLDSTGHLVITQVPTTFPGNFSVKGPRPWIDVTAYGAVGDGVTDNTVSIGNAVSGLPSTGGAIYFPPGVYNTAGAITPGISNVLIFGAGAGSSVIQSTSATVDIIDFGAATGSYSNCSVRDISLTSSVTRTAGNYISFDNVTNGIVSNVAMSGPFVGINLLASSFIFITSTFINAPVASTGVGILVQSGNNYNIGRSAVFLASGTQPLYGLQFQACDSALVADCSFVNTGYGVVMNPASGATVKKIGISGCAVPGCTNDGIFINPASGGTVANIRLTANRLTLNSGNGLNLGTAGTINAVQFISGEVTDNALHGINVGGGTYVMVDSAHIGGNSTASSGTSNGVNIAAGVSKFDVRNCRIGVSPANSSPAQKWGIQVASGSSNNYVINGNDLNDNVTGGLSDGGTGTAKQLVGNLPSTGETKSTFGGALTFSNYGSGTLQTNASGVVSVMAGGQGWAATRQTVVFGPDSSGLPNFLPATSGSLTLTTQNLTVTPLVVSAANGANSTVLDANIFGSANTNFSWSCTASITNYLYVTISGGVLTPGTTSLVPIYQLGGTPSTTNGQFTFNIAEMQGYLGNGSTAPQTNLVFVGEAVAGSSSITSTVQYAYRGYFDSGLTATLPGASANVSYNHNIGAVPKSRPFIYLQCTTANAGYAVGDTITDPSTATASLDLMPTILMNRLIGGFSTASGSAFAVTPKTGGANTNLTAADWSFGMIFSRGW